ncbi:MAG: NHL repeat-containing protein [Candidatus Eremiobacteraeota bacterium]|nr:NHL repeat-containing protein [Candidatus Eremiobacteraeota bacterium]
MLRSTPRHYRSALLRLGASVTLVSFAGCAGAAGNPATSAVSSALNRSVPDAGTHPQSIFAAIPAGKPALSGPIGLAISRKNDLYVANHYGTKGDILIYNSKNQLLKATITDGIDNPADLTFDRGGNLYVTNYYNQTVTVYDAAGKWIKSRTLHTDKSYNPSGVQIDTLGRVWVANRNNGNITIGEIQVFDKNGKVVATATQSLVYPLGIVFSHKTGNAWIANSETPNDDMAIYTQSLQFVKTIATPNFTPTYLAYSKTGSLYATNGLGSDIEVFNSKGKAVQTITNGLNLPYGIAFNKLGYFYAANVGNSTITEYNAKGKLIATIK